MIKNYWQKGTKQKMITIVVGLALLITLFVLRDDYQPAVLFIRKYIFLCLLSVLLLIVALRTFRKTALTGRRVAILGGLVSYFVTMTLPCMIL